MIKNCIAYSNHDFFLQVTLELLDSQAVLVSLERLVSVDQTAPLDHLDSLAPEARTVSLVPLEVPVSSEAPDSRVLQDSQEAQALSDLQDPQEALVQLDQLGPTVR